MLKSVCRFRKIIVKPSCHGAIATEWGPEGPAQRSKLGCDSTKAKKKLDNAGFGSAMVKWLFHCVRLAQHLLLCSVCTHVAANAAKLGCSSTKAKKNLLLCSVCTNFASQ